MPIVRLAEGELRDEVRIPVYDTVDIAAGESPIANRQFFTQVQGRPLSETNLKQNSLLPTAQSFRVQGLALDAQNVYDVNAKALPLIMEHSSIVFTVGEKEYWRGPSRFCAGRIWQHSDQSSLPVHLQQYGKAAVQSVILAGHHVIDINPLENFSIDWVTEGMSAAEITDATPAADTKLRFLFSLKGLFRRPVQ